MKLKFDSIESVVADLRKGRMVIVVDDAEAHDFMMPNASGVYVPVAQNTNPATAAAICGR